MILTYFTLCVIVAEMGFATAAVIPSSMEQTNKSELIVNQEPDQPILLPIRLIKDVLSSPKFVNFQKSHPNILKNDLGTKAAIMESKIRAHKANGEFHVNWYTDTHKMILDVDQETVKSWLSKANNFFDRLDEWYKRTAGTELKRPKPHYQLDVKSLSKMLGEQDALRLQALVEYQNANGELPKFTGGFENMLKISSAIYQSEGTYFPNFVDWVVAQDENSINSGLEIVNKIFSRFVDWAKKKGY